MPDKNSENVVCGEMSLSVYAKKIAQLHEDTLPTLLGRVGAPPLILACVQGREHSFRCTGPCTRERREETKDTPKQKRRGARLLPLTHLDGRARLQRTGLQIALHRPGIDSTTLS